MNAEFVIVIGASRTIHTTLVGLKSFKRRTLDWFRKKMQHFYAVFMASSTGIYRNDYLQIGNVLWIRKSYGPCQNARSRYSNGCF